MRAAPHPLHTRRRLAQALAVHPRVPGSVRQRIRTMLLSMAAAPARRRRLQAIQMPDPVPADYARDNAGLNQLGLNRYVANA